MAKLYNLARVSTATTGAGTITLGSAVSGFLTFAQAGVSNAEVVSYGIRDGANSEVGTGTYTTAGTTLTRTVSKSTNSDSAISLSGTAEVYITATKEDIANLREANVFTNATASSSTSTGALTVAGGIGCGEDVYAIRGNFTNPAGNGGEQAMRMATTQTTVNTGENGDSMFTGAYTLTASSASNQLISRCFLMDATNNLTGGGAITTMRAMNIRGTTNASTTTGSLSHLYIEGTNNGTTTNAVGLHIGQLQGTNLYGIKDDVTGSIWQHAGTTASTSATSGALTVAGGVGIAGALNVAGITTAGYANGAITSDKFQIVHTDVGSGGHFSTVQYGANVNPIKLISYKTRNASPASHTVVTSSDNFFQFDVRASDGDEYIQAAMISAAADGTPSNNVMPTRWVFYTTATNTLVERLRISSIGRLTSSTGQVAHFWVYWTGNSTTMLASHNMDGIADTSTGDADGTITTDFSSANWAGFVITSDASAAGWDADSIQSSGINSKAAGTFGVLCGNMIDGTTAVGTLVDPQQWQVVGFGVSA